CGTASGTSLTSVVGCDGLDRRILCRWGCRHECRLCGRLPGPGLPGPERRPVLPEAARTSVASKGRTREALCMRAGAITAGFFGFAREVSMAGQDSVVGQKKPVASTASFAAERFASEQIRC